MTTSTTRRRHTAGTRQGSSPGPRSRWLGLVATAALSLLPTGAVAQPGAAADSTSVGWWSAPCTEPVLLVQTDKDNVGDHVPAHYPGDEEEFLDRVVTTPGPDGREQATVVFTLNRCEHNEVTTVVNGAQRSTASAADVAEVLVMVLYDGGSEHALEFYALASYVNHEVLAGPYEAIGLPTQLVPGIVYDLPAASGGLSSGVAPLTVEVPGVVRAEGQVIRQGSSGPGGQAAHHHHGPRGAILVEHDAPVGTASWGWARIRITGPSGAWLADLLGAEEVVATGPYLEKEDGHVHHAHLLG